MSRRAAASEGGVGNGAKDVEPENNPQDKQARLLSSEAGHFSMVRALHMADYITAMNGFCGVMSIFSSMRYCMSPPDELGYLWSALAFMPFGLFFDFFDGRVARWRKKSSMMGQELDSLADLISFGVSPAVAAFAIGFRSPLDQLLLTVFVLCGLTRLARFNVTVSTLPKDASGKSKYFEGTPIPTTMGIAALMAYLAYHGSIHEQLPFGTVAEGTMLELHPMVLMFSVHGSLMISKSLHIPKP